MEKTKLQYNLEVWDNLCKRHIDIPNQQNKKRKIRNKNTKYKNLTEMIKHDHNEFENIDIIFNSKFAYTALTKNI